MTCNSNDGLSAAPPPEPAAAPPPPPGGGRPGEEWAQRDIERAAEYRREYYKYVIGIATALLAFTVSFPPQLSRPPEEPRALFLGWIGLGVAVLAGVRVHMVWSKFFISFRNYDNRGKREQGRNVRAGLTDERRILDLVQMIGLAVGVASIVYFTGINLKYIAVKKDEPAAAAVAQKPPATALPASATASPGNAPSGPPATTGGGR